MKQRVVNKLPLVGLVAAIVTVITSGISTSQADSGQPDQIAYLPLVIRQPTPTSSGPDWLIYLNARRALGSLPPLEESADWSTGCTDHARYMVKNDTITHSEDPANIWYTAAGASAAENSNIMISSTTAFSDGDILDKWLTGPFHGVALLDPQLLRTGFGSYREPVGTWHMGACIDILRGLGAVPPSVNFPVMWPTDGAAMPYTAFNGGEYPDPIQGCGFSGVTGPPIYLMLGSGSITPQVTNHSLRQGSTLLQDCVYTEATYVFPGDSAGQNLGRSILNSRDAIILIPRNPFSAGLTYTVSITANGQTYLWSFTTTTAPLQADQPQAGGGLIVDSVMR